MANEKRMIDANGRYTLHASDNTDYSLLFKNGIICVENELGHCVCEFFAEDAPTVDAIVLPCKIDDKVYRIDQGNYHSNWKPFVEELTVTEISWKKEKYGGKDLGFAIIANGIRYKFTSIGKSVFLTQEAARAKMDGDGNA